MKQKNSEKGQALIIIAFAAVAIFAFAALAIDGGMVFSDRRHAQNAADTAALSAALAKTRGQDYSAAAYSRASSNGYNNDTVTNIVSVTTTASPSGACPKTGMDITVDITSYVKTTFARVFGRTQVNNYVTASSRACDVAGGTPLYVGSSVYATKNGSCHGANDSSLLMSGSGNLQVWGGDLGSASTDSNCLDFQGGQTQLKLAESGTDCADIVTAASSGGTFNNVSGQDGCGHKVYNQSFDSPPADLNITCSGNGTKSGSTLNPGNWSGTFPPSGVTTLNPGTYCVNGDFRLNNNESLTGNGVTIVMNTGTLIWNGSSEVHLSAPTTGYDAYGNYTKGLLIYAPPSNSYATGNNQISIDGSGNAKMSGTILAQNLPCYFAGSGQIQKAKIQFICYTWGMNGNGQGEIVYDSSVLFSPLTDPTVTLLK